MKKLLTIALAVVMVMALAVSASAATLYEFTQVGRNDTPAGANIVFADGVNWDDMGGWYPSALTDYMAADVMGEFKTAIQTEGAYIRIAYTGDADVNILFQTYDNNYQWTNTEGTDIKVSVTEEDGKNVAYFDAAAMIARYTDEGMSMDTLLNFGINAPGTTIYSISVVDALPGADAPADEAPATEPEVDEPAVDEPAVEEPAVDEPAVEEPAETGLALAVIPAAIALAVVAFKKR